MARAAERRQEPVRETEPGKGLGGASPPRTSMTGTSSRTARAPTTAGRRGLTEAAGKLPIRGTRTAYGGSLLVGEGSPQPEARCHPDRPAVNAADVGGRSRALPREGSEAALKRARESQDAPQATELAAEAGVVGSLTRRKVKQEEGSRPASSRGHAGTDASTATCSPQCSQRRRNRRRER